MEEMEVVEPVACWGDDFDPHTFDDAAQLEEAIPTAQAPSERLETADVAAKVMTAAEMVSAAAPKLPPVDPELFELAMVVTHPEYGLGKIVALSGSRDKRTASVQFAGPAGEKKFRLAFSNLRPAGKPR